MATVRKSERKKNPSLKAELNAKVEKKHEVTICIVWGEMCSSKSSLPCQRYVERTRRWKGN